MKPIYVVFIFFLFAACKSWQPVTTDAGTTVPRSRPVVYQDNNGPNTRPVKDNEIFIAPLNGQLPNGNYYIVNVKSGLALEGSVSDKSDMGLKQLEKGNARQVFAVRQQQGKYRISMAGAHHLQLVCYCGGGYDQMILSNENRDMAYKIIHAGNNEWLLSFTAQLGNYVCVKKYQSAAYTRVAMGAQLRTGEYRWKFIPENEMSF